MTIKQVPQALVPAAIPPTVQLVPQATPYYLRTPTLQATGFITATEDQTYYTPVYLPGFAFDRISCKTGSSHTGTSTVRLGIYNNDPLTGKPTTVYLDAGTVSCTASNTVYEITISNTPPAGFYWLAFNCQTKTATSQFSAAVAGQNAISPLTMNAVDATNKYSYWDQTGVTGAFTTAASLSINTQSVITALRIA